MALDPPDARAGAADRRVRVLVVDDSAVMRALLDRMLASCPDIEVVGRVASARGAIDCLRATGADVILLDLEMPGMNGFAALPLLIGAGAGARVLVVSSGGGGEAGARARGLGAADALQKPLRLDRAGEFAELLVSRILALGREAASGVAPMAPVPAPVVVAPEAVNTEAGPAGRSASPPAVVGIAASTGGVVALSQLLGALPRDFALPVLVTQHLPGSFLPFFAAQIAEATGRPTRVAETGMPILAGQILVAPGHAHLTAARTSSLLHVRLDEAAAPSGCRPSADPMFASLARLYGAAAIGVILSGMGRDGADGAEALAAQGGAIYAQDQATSVVWGMPGVAVRRGLARAVLPPAEIAGMLARSVAEAPRWS